MGGDSLAACAAALCPTHPVYVLAVALELGFAAAHQVLTLPATFKPQSTFTAYIYGDANDWQETASPDCSSHHAGPP